MSLEKIQNSIDYLIDVQKSLPDKYAPIALIDMDNTLLIGDIGEAVYAQLRAEDHKVHIGWHEYKEILEAHGPGVAYRKIVSSKRGLSPSIIRGATKRIMENGNEIHFYDNEIKITKNPPKPNPLLQEIVNYLMKVQFSLFVITASSKHIADEICSTWFGINEELVFGVENILTRVNDEFVLTGELIEPAPILEGKAELYLKRIDNRSPLIAIGDSLNDVPMLNLVPKEGLKIIVERDPTYTQKILKELSEGEVVIISNEG